MWYELNIYFFIQEIGHFEVHYVVGSPLKLVAFIDSDWDVDPIDRNSTSGCLCACTWSHMLVKNETTHHIPLFYWGQVHRSSECSYKMCVVARYSWGTWICIWFTHSHLVWKSKGNQDIQWSSAEKEDQAHWDTHALHLGAWCMRRWYQCSISICRANC